MPEKVQQALNAWTFDPQKHLNIYHVMLLQYLIDFTLYLMIKMLTSKFLISPFQLHPSSTNVQWTTNDCTSLRVNISGKTWRSATIINFIMWFACSVACRIHYHSKLQEKIGNTTCFKRNNLLCNNIRS